MSNQRNQRKSATPAFLCEHFGHEMQYLVFAAIEFTPGRHFEVPIQDSGMTRGRTVLRFLAEPDKQGMSLIDFMVESSRLPDVDDLTGAWIRWVSERVSHISPNRSQGSWPDQLANEDKNPQRVVNLTRHAIRLTKERASLATDPLCTRILNAFAYRAEACLNARSHEQRLRRFDELMLPDAVRAAVGLPDPYMYATSGGATTAGGSSS